MNNDLNKSEVSVKEANERKHNSDAIRIVRDFQKQYRETIPHTQSEKYQWTVNPPSITEGTLRQQSYVQGFQSIL